MCYYFSNSDVKKWWFILNMAYTILKFIRYIINLTKKTRIVGLFYNQIVSQRDKEKLQQSYAKMVAIELIGFYFTYISITYSLI